MQIVQWPPTCLHNNHQLLSSSGWKYLEVETAFQRSQVIGFLAFPFSYISLVMGTISWHFHHRETVQNNLKFVQKLAVAPFFLIIPTTKVWVMADVCNTTWDLAQKYEIKDNELAVVYLIPMGIFFLVLTLQAIVLRQLNYSLLETTLGSLANLISLCRPTHEESQLQKTLSLYKHETRCSSAVYLTMALTTTFLNLKVLAADSNSIWISLGLACTYSIVTQVYLNFFEKALFPEMLEVDDSPAEVTKSNGPNKDPEAEKKQDQMDSAEETAEDVSRECSLESATNQADKSFKPKGVRNSAEDKECNRTTDAKAQEQIDAAEVKEDDVSSEHHLKTASSIQTPISKDKTTEDNQPSKSNWWKFSQQISKDKLKDKLLEEDNWMHIPSILALVVFFATTSFFAWQLADMRSKFSNY